MADSPLRPLVVQAATDAGLDPEFVTRLVGAESNWNPDAVSKKGARGLMQLMPETAKQYGVSNPNDPVQNIKGGVAFLKDLTAKYPGRPDLVAAAYNAGPGAVDKAGGVPNFSETKDYVQKVDPFAKFAVPSETPAAKTDPFAKYVVSAESAKPEQSTRQTTQSDGDTIVGLQTSPQARAERINRNYEAQQRITKDVLMGMPGMGQAVGAALRGAGAMTEYAGQAAGKIPVLTREILAHLSGLGTPGYVGAAVGPKAIEMAGRATSAAGRIIPRILGTASEAAPVAAKVAAPIEEATAGGFEATKPGGWYTPWEGAERARIVEGVKPPAGFSNVEARPVPSSQAATSAPAPSAPLPFEEGKHLSSVWKAMDKMGVRLRADEMPAATKLMREGTAPEAAIAKVLKDRSVPKAVDIQNPDAEFARKFGLPSQAEVEAEMGKRARGGQKSLMAAYGDK